MNTKDNGEQWKHDLNVSSRMFLEYVWPKVKKWCRSGRLEPVEGVSESGFAEDLDALAGIDAWHIVDGKGMRGIASRVQGDDRIDTLNNPAYRSFTVRKERTSGSKTEWVKRREQLGLSGGDKSGYISPHLTVQSYVDTSGLMAAYMVRTRDLYQFAQEKWRGRIWEETAVSNDNADNPERGGNIFGIFWVNNLTQQDGVVVKRYEREGAHIVGRSSSPSQQLQMELEKKFGGS